MTQTLNLLTYASFSIHTSGLMAAMITMLAAYRPGLTLAPRSHRWSTSLELAAIVLCMGALANLMIDIATLMTPGIPGLLQPVYASRTILDTAWTIALAILNLYLYRYT